MSQPHVCPVCTGFGRAPVAFIPLVNGEPIPVPCPACKGACVLWEPDFAKEMDKWLASPRYVVPDKPTIHRYPADPGPDFNVKASKEAMDQERQTDERRAKEGERMGATREPIEDTAVNADAELRNTLKQFIGNLRSMRDRQDEQLAHRLETIIQSQAAQVKKLDEALKACAGNLRDIVLLEGRALRREEFQTRARRKAGRRAKRKR